MISNILTRIFGSRNERLLKQYSQAVRQINALEPATAALTDEALQAKTAEFKERVAKGEALDAILPEAFAVVREAGKRTLGMRHFDVQLIGGIALHNGKIAEMRTGEGKTLVATLPAYLNALAGKGVHLVTVNDYLAQRDADWMGRIYRFLGLTVGVNLSQMAHAEKQAAYNADITYGTNNEYGFDYLRDNMVFQGAERVQRHLSYAIVDEVDSILIDEARTPLIISGQADDNVETYYRLNELPVEARAAGGRRRARAITSSTRRPTRCCCPRRGHEKAEGVLSAMGLIAPGSSLYDAQNISLVHHLYAALRAHALYHLDQHYVVQNGEVIIVDEFTGRLMSGRRWSDGLHQAVEAKEGVPIQRENQTLASITFQNYFRMYGKLAGMTGTADTEAFEFQQIYHLETVVIPTNLPMIRKDANDQVYRTFQEKIDAIIADVRDCHERGQPVLVGTTSIENSELLSKYMEKEKLRARGPQRETARARGGNRRPGGEVGLHHDRHQHGGPRHRHRARRQHRAEDPGAARGRVARARRARAGDQPHARGMAGAARRRDPGRRPAHHRHRTARIAADRQPAARPRGSSGRPRQLAVLPVARGPAAAHLRRRAARRHHAEAQDARRRADRASDREALHRQGAEPVESRNFDIRKQLLEYDDVANDQRKVIYQQRNELLEASDISETIRNMIRGETDSTVPALRSAGVGRGAVGSRRPPAGAAVRFPDAGAGHGVGRQRPRAHR